MLCTEALSRLEPKNCHAGALDLLEWLILLGSLLSKGLIWLQGKGLHSSQCPERFLACHLGYHWAAEPQHGDSGPVYLGISLPSARGERPPAGGLRCLEP